MWTIKPQKVEYRTRDFEEDLARGKNMKKKTWMGALAIATLLGSLVQAQDQGLGDMMFTAGTVATDASGQERAWILWMATDNALLPGRSMDVYWKAGDASSGNAFTLKGRAMQVTDPRAIALLLARGEALGENLENLEGAVDSLYAGAEPAGSLSLAEKLAALISGSQDDPELYSNLVFMGRAHPAVSMAIGQGFACKIPNSGYSTFEVRDAATEEVIGRLVLEAGNPVVLPAPGPIVRVPETSPKGNLNIRLRWDIPDDLRRLSLLQFGYNLYRVAKDSADDWWGPAGAPPSTAELLDYVANYESAKKVNRMPILVDAALTTSNTWYAVDDNDGQLPGGTPFVDGEEYYYYVTALDLLARDGEVSDPFSTFPCDRMAPSVPHGITTRTVSEYAGGARNQYVEVSWDHDTNDVDTARYYVYRHTSLSNMQANATFALSNRISGAIIPAPTATRMVYEDRTLSTNDYGRTYWYTVRAEDDARCANNLSGNSAPAYGLLRDWQGPPPATGVVATIQVESLFCSFDSFYSFPTTGIGDVEIACSRPDPGSRIRWAEFSYYEGEYQGAGSETNAISLGRHYFLDNEIRVSASFLASNKQQVNLFCQVGSNSGKTSPVAVKSFSLDNEIGVLFKGEDVLVTVPADSDPGPHVWDYPNPVFPVFEIPATPGAETVRLYRRVDGGRRTLVHQGEMDDILGALIADYSGGSANGGTVCYYYQLFDEHGNAGPMVKICCFMVEPRVDLPTPILNPVDSTGTATSSPGLEMNWFCTVPGIERFEVAVALDDGPLPATFGTANYELQGGVSNMIEVVEGGATNTLPFGFYRTGRVGSTFGSMGSPLFSLDSGVGLNREYTFMVRAVGTTGTLGEWSNVETFRWSTVPDTEPQVPWPTREMPVIQEAEFHPGFGAVFLDDATYLNLFETSRVGIRIGEMPPSTEFEYYKSAEVRFYSVFDPVELLYTNAFNNVETVMPCVLYRYQLTNDLYRTVSGDVAQVSPMMEEIAYGKNPNTTVYDPFIVFTRKQSPGDPWGVFLLDTQPVVRGATYQYLLVRFDEDTKEIDRVIPAGTVTIP